MQLGDAETLPEGEKPKMASLFKDMSPSTVGLDEALSLLSLPRTVGDDPESGEEIVALNGRYGPYLRKGGDTRSLGDEDELFTVTVDEALRLFAEPKRRGRQAAAPPLRELGDDPVSGKPVVVKSGRYGPYVTDGETNASLRERDGDTVEGITPERAAELLQIRRDAGPAKQRGARRPGQEGGGQEGDRQEDPGEEGGGEEDDRQEGRGQEGGGQEGGRRQEGLGGLGATPAASGAPAAWRRRAAVPTAAPMARAWRPTLYGRGPHGCCRRPARRRPGAGAVHRVRGRRGERGSPPRRPAWPAGSARC